MSTVLSSKGRCAALFLGLCLLALPGRGDVASTQGEGSETEGSATWLLVAKGGETSRWEGRPELGAPEVAAGSWDGAWVWSRDSAPLRLSWAEVEAGEPGPEQGANELTVRIAGLPREGASVVQLRAAPLEMWLEVPESQLPLWSLGREGQAVVPYSSDGTPWLLRATGPGVGSWWVEVPPGRTTAQLSLSPAEDLSLRVVDEFGHGIPGVRVGSQEAAGGRLGQARQFGWQPTDDDGLVLWPSVPDAEAVRLTFLAGSHVPSSVRGVPSSLPRRWMLEQGLEVEGRIVDQGGEPVQGARIELVTQPETFPYAWRLRTISGPDGSWELDGVPASDAGVIVEAEGYGGFTRRLDLAQGGAQGVAVGEWVLRRSIPVSLRVVDERGVGVKGAVVGSEAESQVSDETGLTLLKRVPRGKAYSLRIEAPGHLAAKTTLLPPHEGAQEVTVSRALVVSGRLVDSSGAPLPDGQLRMVDCDLWDQAPVGPDGRFQVDLVPDSSYEMVFTSPSTGAVRQRLLPGQPGERRNLGDVVLPDGRAVRGRLVAGNGRPVVGARVWMARDASDPLTAWVRRDLLESRSDAEGNFVLSGASASPAALRVNAPGSAPLRLPVEFPPGVRDLDLGEVELTSGLELVVVSEGFDPEGAVARLDLGDSWRDMDVVEAPFSGSTARLSQVPAGSHSLVVMRDWTVLCREEVALAEAALEVRCGGSGMNVRGQVTAGGEAVGSGTLSWFPESHGSLPGIVIRRRSALGIGREDAFGAGLPQVEVAVDEAGRFVTGELAPGRWRVVWRSDLQAASEPVEVEVPRRPEHELTISLPGRSLRGWVSAADGEPVSGARVRLLESGALTFSGEDGEFTFVGLPPGDHHLRASLDDKISTVEQVTLDGRPPDPVELMLADAPGESTGVSLRVLDDRGLPAVGALVIVDVAGGGQRILTTDTEGAAMLGIDPPWPGRVKAAAWTPGGWVLGGWIDWGEVADEGVLLEVGPVGDLVVEGDDTRPVLGVLDSAGGWDLLSLLRRLGRVPRADAEHRVTVRGLPVGVYSVGDPTVGVRQVMIREEQAYRVTMD